MGEIIAVLSGKGGTGKTTVCAGVATALASPVWQSGCIDCDIGLRNLDISLGMSDIGALSFLDVCRGEYQLDRAARHPDFPSLAFLTAPMQVSPEEIVGRDFCNMLRRARELFDYIFLDAPAGVDAGFRLAAGYADRAVLVTGADPASIRDARRAGELLELMGKDNVRLVVNRIDSRMVSGMKLTVDDIMDRAGLPLLGVVPEDANVTFAAAGSQPLIRFTKRGAAAACKRIAQRIQGLPVPITLR